VTNQTFLWIFIKSFLTKALFLFIGLCYIILGIGFKISYYHFIEKVVCVYVTMFQVLEAADVVLEVIDARDPLGTRCKQVEQAVLESSGNKRLVLVLNKAGLYTMTVTSWIRDNTMEPA
jgi:hypothetical protein